VVRTERRHRRWQPRLRVRYDQFEHDAKGISARAGGGRIAWFQDPDGNTFAIEADV
jgi:hypothetical protein